MTILKQLKEGYISQSAEETIKVAYAFGKTLEDNSMVILNGNLGVGKTTFVRGLAQACKIHQEITSPSFNIFHHYKGLKRNLIHIDAYRLENDSQLEDLILEEFMEIPYIMAVEWPKNFHSFQSKKAWYFSLNILNEKKYLIKLLQ